MTNTVAPNFKRAAAGVFTLSSRYPAIKNGNSKFCVFVNIRIINVTYFVFI